MEQARPAFVANHATGRLDPGLRAVFDQVSDDPSIRKVVLSAVATPPPPIVEWTRLAGPYFGNDLMTLRLDGRSAGVLLEQAGPADEPLKLTEVTRLSLT